MSVRLSALLLLVLALGGCGTQFIYNNLDWLLARQAQDYLDLDRPGRADLRVRIDRVLAWHRRDELPRYAAVLERAAADFADGITAPELEQLLDTAEGWWFQLLERGAPEAGVVLHGLSPNGVEHLAQALEARHREWLEEAGELGEAGMQAEWVEDVERGLRQAIGRLDDQQRALLERTSKRFTHSPQEWIAYRRAYQADLLALLREDLAWASFEPRFLGMARNYRAWFTPGYREQHLQRQEVFRGLLLELDELLSQRQRERLVDWLRGLADDFRELAADARDAGQ